MGTTAGDPAPSLPSDPPFSRSPRVPIRQIWPQIEQAGSLAVCA